MRLVRRLWYFLNRHRLEQELREEIASHRAEMKDGKRFGNDLALREQADDVWGWGWLDTLVADIRIALRSLQRNAMFSLTAVVSLSGGIWLVAITASVVGAYLQNALPYANAKQLYHVTYAPPGPWEPPGMSRFNWSEMRPVVDAAITASSIPAYLPRVNDRPAAPMRALAVNADFASGLGVRPALGTFDSVLFRTDAEPSAMIGYSLWRQWFNGDSAVVGKLFQVRNEAGDVAESYRIVGVLPRGFYFGRDSRDTVDIITQLRRPFQSYMLRLHGGVTPQLAQERITLAIRNQGSAIPADWAGVTLESVHDRYIKEMRPLLRSITASAGLFFLIVCVNLAVLTLLRSLQRQKEMAVRAALGAGRLRLLRIPLIESALLTFGALASALALTALVLKLAAPGIAAQLGRPSPRGADGYGIDLTVVAASAVASIIVVILLSLVPLAGTAADRLQKGLRSSDRSSSSGPGLRRVRSSLLVLEIAASLALLIGSGLMIQSVVNVLNLPRGFDATGIVRARLGYPATAFRTPEARVSFFTQFRDATEAATGVRPVFSNWPPFAEQPERLIESDAGVSANAGFVSISDGYAASVRMQVKRGRDFSPADRVGAAPVAMVSESLAKALWPGGNVLGGRIRHLDVSARDTAASEWLTVVGVMGDVRSSFKDQQQLDVYTSYMQTPPNRFATITMRSGESTEWWSTSLTKILKTVDSRIVTRLSTPLDWGDTESSEARFIARLLVTLSALALLLAVVGIFAVTAYSVKQRERETAIRLALGATENAIRRLFLRGGVPVVVVGSVLGAVIAIVGTRVLASRMYGVATLDLPTYLIAASAMGVVALGAVWLPTVRAASPQSLRKLRGED